MLTLMRRKNESLRIGADVHITIVAIRGTKVLLGIEAPRHIEVVRDDAVVRTPKSPEPVEEL